jgi:hypothetical protein
MNLFARLFPQHGETESVILVDIGAASVAGGYARYAEGLTTIVYAQRVPIVARRGEASADAMLRALTELCDALLREGAPALRRATGSGRAGIILLSVDAPWQETRVRTVHADAPAPFVCTRSLIDTRVKETRPAAPGRIEDESVLRVLLNGYPVAEPEGMHARSMDIDVLTSRITAHIAEESTRRLRGAFHTTRIYPVAGAALRYRTFRTVFPYEAHLLAVDATADTSATLMLVRDGRLALVAPVAVGEAGASAALRDAFAAMAERYPMPHTLFVLARGDNALTAALPAVAAAQAGPFGAPRVIRLSARHLAARARQEGEADVPLLLMAAYYAQYRDSIG